MLYLYSAATDLARLKDDAALAELMRRKWTNIVSRKLYLTGGLGHSRHSEGFAADYDLPNDIAYCETCAAIANVFWQQRLFLASGDAAYVDVLERSLYNNVLAGVALERRPLLLCEPARRRRPAQVQPGPGRAVRVDGLPLLPGQPGAPDPARGRLLLRGARRRGVREPVCRRPGAHPPARRRAGRCGRTRATRGMAGCGSRSRPRRSDRLPCTFAFPGWARGRPVPDRSLPLRRLPARSRSRCSLNGQPVPVTEEKGYAVLRRAWRPGDRIELNLPMPVRRVLAHEKVKDNAGPGRRRARAAGLLRGRRRPRRAGAEPGSAG